MGKYATEMNESPGRNHNNPPEVLELATEVCRNISTWMADNPVVASEEAARDMKLQVDRAKLCIKDLESERDNKVRPLNDRVASINYQYRVPRRMLGNLLDEMLSRIQIFVKEEERRRHEMFLELERRAREAEAAAKEAERIEREKLDDASKGEVGIDVAEVIANADQAFEEYEKAERKAILAKKETHVKVGGGLGRAIGLREKETLSVKDVMAAIVAINELGLTPDIHDAILKSARAYRKVHGKLPTGVQSSVEEKL